MLKKFDMEDGVVLINMDHVLWATPAPDVEGRMLLTIDHLDHDGGRMSLMVFGNIDDLI